MTFGDLCTDVLVEMGVFSGIGAASAEDLNIVLRMGQRLIDNWNADREAIYADDFLTETITPSLQPHTIGPTAATWTVTQRPVSIEGAKLIISSTQTYELNMRDAAWWNARIDPGFTTSLPTDLFYNPTSPNGSVYFWGVPTAAYSVQLWVRTVLASYSLTTTLTMPPGYRDAMTLTLKEMCADSFGKTLSEKTMLDASKARARIFNNNVVVPTIDAPIGLPGDRGGWYDYRTGRVL